MRPGIIAAIATVLVLAFGGFAVWHFSERMTYRQATVSIPDGTTLAVEIASTPQARSLGLGGRAGLAQDAGMLFLFDTPGTYGFWMKDMRFPIDIIWLRDGEVVGVDADVPLGSDGSLPVYRPAAAVNQALETNAGFAKAHEITAGERLDIREANR